MDQSDPHEKVSRMEKKMDRAADTTSFIRQVFDSKKELIIIGLCGRKGSGCSTAAKILHMGYEELSAGCDSRFFMDRSMHEREEHGILNKYAEKNWKSFDIVKVSALICASALRYTPKVFSRFLFDIDKEKVRSIGWYESICAGFFERRVYIRLSTVLNDAMLSGDQLWQQIQSAEIIEQRYDYPQEEGSTQSFVCPESEMGLQVLPGTSWISITNEYLYRLFVCYRESRQNEGRFDAPFFSRLLARYIYQDLPIWCAGFWQAVADDDISMLALQLMGLHLRVIGAPFYTDTMDMQEKGYLTIAKDIDTAIMILRDDHFLRNKAAAEHVFTLIAIDSIRNPYESQYFADRYSSYYLFGIYAEDRKYRNDQESLCTAHAIEQQIGYLVHDRKYRYFQSGDEHIDKALEQDHAYRCMIAAVHAYIRKYDADPKEGSYHFERQIPYILQNVTACLEKADIYCDNVQDDGRFLALKESLIRYVCLIMHPGLVLPTPVERFMQIAYTVRANSGCVSRQVGAVITDAQYHMLSIGWNHEEDGRPPCLYRDINKVGDDIDEIYREGSECLARNYTAGSLLSGQGIRPRYCYKDLYNDLSGERDPGYTRALHAEEAALRGLRGDPKRAEGGFLFTTTSPCMQCYKKAMEHHIVRIYYVERYPGTPIDGRLADEEDQVRPELVRATGAFGHAYMRLYTPVLPAKKEDALWSGKRLEEFL